MGRRERNGAPLFFFMMVFHGHHGQDPTGSMCERMELEERFRPVRIRVACRYCLRYGYWGRRLEWLNSA